MSGDGASVVFSTYQSSPQIAAAQASGAPRFDLVIADEAHHCAGKIDSAFATVLDADSLKATRRLFMTATPRYLSRRIKDSADQLDIQVSSMDDLEVFGPEMHVLTFGQSIEDGLLSDYQVLILGITDTEIEELRRIAVRETGGSRSQAP
jgi:predicted helicase